MQLGKSTDGLPTLLSIDTHRVGNGGERGDGLMVKRIVLVYYEDDLPSQLYQVLLTTTEKKHVQKPPT